MGFWITRWDPFRELVSLKEGILRSPAMDVEETDDEVVVRAELPGISKQEIKLQIQENLLTIHGERKQPSELKNRTAHWIECSYGGFQRSVALPVEVDPSKAKATFENGLLTVHLPKCSQAKPSQAKPKEISIEEN